MQIYKNGYFELTVQENQLFIVVIHPGFDIRDFNPIMSEYPIIKLTNFTGLRAALAEATGEPVQIGSVKPRIDVIVSNDEMQASIYINVNQNDLEANYTAIVSEISTALTMRGVTEGLQSNYERNLSSHNEVFVAIGVPPLFGEDAKVTYYELSEKRPIVKEDGSVNHYELNLIDNVKAGDWLGERIPPQEGKPGITVTGKQVPGRNGKDSKLKYDRKTVGEYVENGKTVLRALVDGAVKFEGGKIRIDNHLIIPGDVGFETGNINFEGYVSINGTIKDGFSVTAKYDIAINGSMGIGAVGKVHSKDGSIYIKGGIYGKNIAHIEAKQNIYVKYCNESTLIAGEDINIGFYSLDSVLKAQKVLLDPKYGKIIGGSVTAEVKVVTGVIGNKSEKKTIISVEGFDRNAIRKEFEMLLERYKELLQEANTVKRQIEVFEYNLSGAEYANMEEYNKCIDHYDQIVDEIKFLDEARKKLQATLQTKGEGEVGILQSAYPETYLEIKKMQKRISSIVSGSFYAENRELRHN